MQAILGLTMLVMIAGGQADYRVYPAGKPVIPKYWIRQTPQGTKKIWSNSTRIYKTAEPVLPQYYIVGDRVYDAKNIVVPKFYIRDNKLYPAQNPVIPTKRVKP